jgi:hypothetical protein
MDPMAKLSVKNFIQKSKFIKVAKFRKSLQIENNPEKEKIKDNQNPKSQNN